MLTSKLQKIALASLALGGVIMSSSCTSMVTEEQLAMLQDLRNQKASLSAEIKRVQDDTRSLQSELSRKKADADDCERKKKFVEDKLKNWPNVWPDYDPTKPSVKIEQRGN
jgi:septal ring factor EnvC (AmiA/AmiB activator)